MPNNTITVTIPNTQFWNNVSWDPVPPPPSPPPVPESYQYGQSLNQTIQNHQLLYGGKKKMPEASMKPKEKIYNLTLDRAFPRQLTGKMQDGEIGLEIECEGTNLFNAPIQWWVTHSDGSLRPHGEHPPIEYVLKRPIPREEVPKALSYLTAKLKQSGSTIDDSPRTSVHVHINCQKLTIKQIYQFVCLYLIFEEMLVDFSGPERVGNLFCLGAKHAEYFVQVMESAITTEDFREFFSNELRYSSCNTASVGKFGSLEFRSMRGTVDQKLIQMWVDLLLMIRDKALEYDNPREIVEDFQAVRPEAFLHKIFGSRPDISQVFSTRGDFHTSMWDGLRLMRDVAYAVKWEKPLPVKKKGSTKNGLVSSPQPNGDGFDYYVIQLPSGLEYRRYENDAPGTRWVTNVSLSSTETQIDPNSNEGPWFFGHNIEHRIAPNGKYQSFGSVGSATRDHTLHNLNQVPLPPNAVLGWDEEPEEEESTTPARVYDTDYTHYIIDSVDHGPGWYWICNVSGNPQSVLKRNGMMSVLLDARKKLFDPNHNHVSTEVMQPQDY